MWRTFAGLRPLARNTGRNAGFRLFSSAKPKKRMGMKELVKEFGWTATGIYIAFSCIDLPLSYLLVHSAGQEKIEDAEIACRRILGADPERESTYIHKAATGGKSLFLAEFGIAYIIHKSLIVFRVPLTVAVTPVIAKKLGQWGFNVTRALPTVDKEQLASKVAARAETSSSATLRKAAEKVSKETNKPASEVLDEAAKLGKKGEDALKNSVKDIKAESHSPKFGEPPSQRRRWFWFF